MINLNQQMEIFKWNTPLISCAAQVQEQQQICEKLF